jgi:hypothetical protein
MTSRCWIQTISDLMSSFRLNFFFLFFFPISLKKKGMGTILLKESCGKVGKESFPSYMKWYDISIVQNKSNGVQSGHIITPKTIILFFFCLFFSIKII